MDQGSIKIAGNGMIQSGNYDEIKIMGNASSEGNIVANTIKVMGDAKFQGDVECEECSVFGNCRITGNIKIGRLKVNGDFTMKGACQVDELIVNGGSTISGKVICKTMIIKGSLRLSEDCIGNSIKIYGDITTPSNISCEEIVVEGKIDCKGLLNTEKLYLHPTTHSYCKEIGATEIEVVKPFYHFLWLSYHKKNTLTCEVIEGDVMKLENVVAKVVRGKNIELIQHCDIDTIEYGETYQEGSNCTVREAIKID